MEEGVKAQQLALEGQTSYSITDMWERQKELEISLKKEADKGKSLYGEGSEPNIVEDDFEANCERPSRYWNLCDLPRGLAIVPERIEREQPIEYRKRALQTISQLLQRKNIR